MSKEDRQWYADYVHPEKYDVSKWGEYLARIDSESEKSNPAKEEQLVRDNMREFYRTGSSDHTASNTPTQKKTLDMLYDCLQTDNLVEKAGQIYNRVDEPALKKELEGCKVLIITANEIERNILHYKISKEHKEYAITRVIYGNIAYFIFQWGEYKVVHVHQHQMGSHRDWGMRKTLEEVLTIYRPNVVFSMGVAFGIDPTVQNIGDVLVSHKLFPYSENKIKNDIILPDRSQDKVIDNWLDVRFVNTPGFLEGVTYGSILSGGTVLSSEETKEKICRAYSKQDFVIGGEMEGSALFQICTAYDIPCAVIKGICDWGSLKNGIFSSGDENEDAQEKEERLKTCAQALAMTRVFEKCNVLFKDGTLFSYPKTRAIDAERKGSKILFWMVMALFAVIIITPFVERTLPALYSMVLIYEVTFLILLSGGVRLWRLKRFLR